MKLKSVLPFLASVIAFASCNNSGSVTAEEKKENAPAQLKEENITYSADSITMKGYVVYKDSSVEKRPAVIVVHEWWGMNNYSKGRAKQLAELGYVAMAVDMYGNGQTAEDPKSAEKLAMPFYLNPQLIKTRLGAAIQKLKTYPNVDINNIAAIGYCFGGFVVLNAAKLGEPLKGVVSFHGNLSGVVPDKNLLKSKILVCHGANDKFVSEQEVNTFKKQMDSVGAHYTFKVYPNATHAFTNPEATEKGRKYNMPIEYNAEADKNSWKDMKDFLDRLFKN